MKSKKIQEKILIPNVNDLQQNLQVFVGPGGGGNTMSKQLAITSLLANRATGQKTPRVPLQVQPAAKPKLGRPLKPRPQQKGPQLGQQHEAGQQQELQQEL